LVGLSGRNLPIPQRTPNIMPICCRSLVLNKKDNRVSYINHGIKEIDKRSTKTEMLSIKNYKWIGECQKEM